MPQQPVPADPGPEEDLAWLDRDPVSAEERAAWLDRVCEHDDPPEEQEYEDYAPLTPAELAEIREAAADDLLAVEAATTGRRGPGQPGSARVFPGESASPAAAFGPGLALDVLPGCAGLAVAAEAAAEDGFAGVSEAELIGMLCAWDRIEAHAAACKLAAIAELGRRNPGPLDEEFTADQLGCALGETRARAHALLATASHLDTHLPGTRAALDDGTLSMAKAQIIASATGLLDPAEAAAAEDEVLDRAARLTPPGLRAAIARAVMDRTHPLPDLNGLVRPTAGAESRCPKALGARRPVPEAWVAPFPVTWRRDNPGDRAQRRLQLRQVGYRPVPAGDPAGSLAGLRDRHAGPGDADVRADVGGGDRVRSGR